MTEHRASALNALKTSENRTGERYGVTSHGKRNQLKISRLQLAGARGCRVKHLNRPFPVLPRREWLSDWFVFVQLKLLGKKLDSEARAEIQVFIYMTARRFLSALVQRATDGARRWMLGVRYYSTLTPPLFLCPHHYASVPSHTFSPLSIHLTYFYPSPNLLARNPFFVSRKALDCIIQYSYFHLHYSSSLNSALKKAAFLLLGELLSHLLWALANLLI